MNKIALTSVWVRASALGPIACFALAIGLGSAPTLVLAGHAVPDREPVWDMEGGGVLLSASRRFVVSGYDHRENLLASNWAETIDRKLRAVSGIDLLGDHPRSIRIILREREDRASGTIEVAESVGTDRISHRIAVVNAGQVDYEVFQGMLCQILLRRHILALARRAGRDAADSESEYPEDGGLPAWLWEGLSQNVLPGVQTRNMRLIVGEWRRGRLPPVGAFLNPNAPLDIIDPKRDWNTLRRRAAYGAFMMWFLSFPERGERLGKILERLAAGETVSAEQVAKLMPDSESAGDMDENWDEWMLAQSRMIRQPGILVPENMDRLEEELLLYPGDYAIPMTGNLYEKIEWDDLIDRREEFWIPAFARAKSAGLRLAAVGRGPDIVTVSEAYVRFLDALRRGRRESLLRERLDAAQTLWRHLARQAHGPSPLPTPEPGEDGSEKNRDPFDAEQGLGLKEE